MARILTVVGIFACFISFSLCISTWNPQAVGFGLDPLPGFYHDRVVFSRVNYDPVNLPWMDNDLILKNSNVTTLRIINDNAGDLVITALAFADPTMFSCDQVGQVPKTIAAGAHWDITLHFIAVGGDKGPRMSQLTIQSNDPVTPSKAVGLAGAYLAAPEGGNEIFLQDILTVLGWTTNVAELQPTYYLNWPHLSENMTDSPRGDEWFAPYWKAADPNKPILIREVASFLHCCTNSPRIEIVDKDTDTTILLSNNYDPLYGQSVLPAGQSTDYADSNANTKTTATFYFKIEYDYKSTETDYIGMHFYRLRDRDGNVVPDAFVVPHDYVKPYYKGCLDPYVYGGYANCDFQDNVFVVWNIAPADPPLTAAPGTVTPITTTTVSATTTVSETTTVSSTTLDPTTDAPSVAGGAVTTISPDGPSTGTPAPTEATTTQQNSNNVATTTQQSASNQQETTQQTDTTKTQQQSKPLSTTTQPSLTLPPSSNKQQSAAGSTRISLVLLAGSFLLYMMMC